MSNFFTADLHLGCRGVYKEYAHPFATYDIYEQTVIDNINSVCKPSDSLYVVGDLIDYEDKFYRDAYWDEAFNRTKDIQCKIQLILGNNETRLLRDCFGNDEESFEKYLRDHNINCLGMNRMISMHSNIWYLVHRMTQTRRDVLNIYGHQHRESSVTSAGINASISLTGYYPLSEKQLMMLVWRSVDYTISAQQMPIVPHHGT